MSSQRGEMVSNQFRWVKRSTESDVCASCSVVNRTSATEGNAQICIPAIAWTNRDNLSYSTTKSSRRTRITCGLHSSLGAIAWILVSKRVCSVTSRALDVSRCHVFFFKSRERTYPGAAHRTPSRTQIARTLTRMALQTEL